MIFQLIFRNGG